jgi:hypothetical protein
MMTMMMMMMIRPMTVMTTTAKQVSSSSNTRDMYLRGAQFESWPPNYLGGFFLIFLSPTWCQNNVLKLDHDRFHPYLFEFIIYYHPNIQRYIVRDTDSITK